MSRFGSGIHDFGSSDLTNAHNSHPTLYCMQGCCRIRPYCCHGYVGRIGVVLVGFVQCCTCISSGLGKEWARCNGKILK